MGESKLNVFNLGNLGVNVDKSPLHLADGELRSAQNAIADSQGNDGAIRKRPGLARFNSVAGSGSMLGGIGVPLTLTAMSVGGVTLGGGVARKTFWGRRVQSATMGATAGWFTSTSGFTTAASTITVAPPSNPRSAEIPDGLEATFFTDAAGMPASSAVVSNNLIYPSASYTPGTDPIPVYIFDGTVDKKLVDIPRRTGALFGAVISMLAVGDVIYVSTYDDDNAAGAISGRVFQLNPSSGSLIQMGADFTGVWPSALAFHAGQLWAGVSNGTNAGIVYRIRPNIDTAWTLDRTLSAGNSCPILISYNGELFAGGRGANAPIDKRSSIGVWSVSATFGGGSNVEFTSAVTFNGNLYVSYHPTVSALAAIYKYNGASWTNVYTAAGGEAHPAAWVDNGVMYFGGGGHNIPASLVSSPDGTVWTNRTANLSAGAFSALAVVGTLTV